MLLALTLFGAPAAEHLPQTEPPAVSPSTSLGTSNVEPPKVSEYRLEYVKKKLIKKGLDPAEVEELFGDPRLYVHKEPPQGSIDWAKLEKNILSPESVERGKQFLENRKEALARIHRKYGVAPEYVVAVFRIETNLGMFFGNYSATGVFYRKLSRQNWREHAEQLVSLVLYCKQAGEDCHAIKSSYEGAFGLGQFMPLSYLHFAEDGNGDGVIDLFDPDDAAMSTAKFLNKHGWKKSKERALISYYG